MCRSRSSSSRNDAAARAAVWADPHAGDHGPSPDDAHGPLEVRKQPWGQRTTVRRSWTVTTDARRRPRAPPPPEDGADATG